MLCFMTQLIAEISKAPVTILTNILYLFLMFSLMIFEIYQRLKLFETNLVLTITIFLFIRIDEILTNKIFLFEHPLLLLKVSVH